MLKPIVVATLVAGTLDILSAVVFAGMAGVSVGAVLQFVASGPFGDGMLESSAGYPLGLLVHYGIMFAMAAVYIWAARRVPALIRRPIVSGVLYGLLLWGIMYWIVHPLRWPEMPLPSGTVPIAKQLFSHCILVGVPIALITARHFRNRPFAR